MSNKKTVGRVAGFTVLTALVTMMMASSVFAQEKVCVNLLVGAGYAAKLKVWVNWKLVKETGSFAIGQQKCITLSELAPAGTSITPGTRIVTSIQAYLGQEKACTPAPFYYDPKRVDNVIYNAWGTTLNVKCSQQ